MNTSEDPLRDVLAIVCHDLRTPLSVVHTTSSMLLNPRYKLTPEQVREQHERIRRNAELMNRMIGDLTDMTSLRTGTFSIEPHPVEINELLREAVTTQQAAADGRKLQLEFDAGPETLAAQADRARLLQLFQTLIAHAIKACEAGNRIGVVSRREGAQALIDISDNGPGLDPAEVQQVFDGYRSDGGKWQKTAGGLGLHIAKGIVDAHGGQIRCVSTPGAGTTFSIALPLGG